MKLIKCLILTLIVAICEAGIIRESTSYSSRPRIAENSFIEGSFGGVNPSAYNSGKTRAVRPQRPNVAPIRPGYPARSDSWRSQAPEATSWRKLQSSQPHRELIFVSRRNMRERSGAAESNSRRRHSRIKHHHRNNSERTQAPRVQTPTELPLRPAFTTESSASSRYSNPEAFARSGLQSSNSQRKQTFVSPPRQIRTNPCTTKTNLRGNYYNSIRTQGTNGARTQAPRVQTPTQLPIRPAFTTEPSASFRYRNPEAFARSGLQSSNSQRKQTFVSPPRQIRTNPCTTKTNLRGNYYNSSRTQGTNGARTQAPRVQTPTQLPIRPAFTTEPSASFRYRNPEAFARSGLQSSNSQRKQTFVSPPRQIRTNPCTTKTNLRGNYYNSSRTQGTNGARTQAPRVQTPTQLPIRPAFTTEPSASFRYRNPEAFARSGLQSSNSQRKQTFVSPPRQIRTNPCTTKTNLRGNYYNSIRTQGTNGARTQAPRVQTPTQLPIRPAFTRRPSESSRYRNPKAFARRRLQSPSATIRIITK